jgi:hypothetical protein
MTQSKKDNDTFTISLDDHFLNSMDNSISVNLDDTYGTTTTYWGGDSDSISDTVNISDGTFTIDTNSADWLSEIHINDTRISPEEIERMCKEYPSLEKVWRNFKSVYDMCKQDYEGKKKAGEIDDDIPF